MSRDTPKRSPKRLAVCVNCSGDVVDVVRLADGRLVLRRSGLLCGIWPGGQLDECLRAMLAMCGATDASTELTASVRRVPAHADN